MYKFRKTIWIALVLAVGLMTAACASNDIDDPSSPNVVLTVQTMTVPPTGENAELSCTESGHEELHTGEQTCP